MSMNSSTLAFATVVLFAVGAQLRRKQQRDSRAKAAMERTLLRFNLTVDEINAAAEEIKQRYTAVYDAVASVTAEEATWDNTLGPVLALSEELDALSSNVRLPKNVATEKAVRDASAEATSMLKKMHVSLSLRRDVYLAIKAYTDKGLTRECPEERRFQDRTLREYRRLGMDLSDDTRNKVETLKREMKELETKYLQNIAEDDTKLAFTKEQLKGMPDGFVSSLEKQADGKYEITMAYPHVLPILRNCAVPDTRRQVRVAFDRRAIGENVDILEKVVKLRAQTAALLGYNSHAELELEETIAKSPTTALPFLTKLGSQLKPLAEAELEGLKNLKEEEEGSREFFHWDTMYYQRSNTERKHQVSGELVAEYFPLPVVQERMLDIYQKLLGVNMKQVADPYVWHKDVTMWSVHNKNDDGSDGYLIGYFYLDLYPRPGKYNHACCVPMQCGYGRNADGSPKRIAVAGMLANFAQPTADRPSLLRHDDVVTFFHEFGHVMHHLLSSTKNVAFASFDVEMDFVEAPSQMLENWCWELETVQLLSGHFKDTSKPLPAELARGLAASKLENTAMLTMRQLMFGVFDLTIHGIKPDEEVDTERLLKEMYPEYLLVDYPETTNFAAAFGHLCGGYDAKYYSYMWSEVYSADMFYTRFKKEGLLNPATGMSYRRNILAPGGSRDALESVTEFLGRAPSFEAFLRTKGLGSDE